MPRRVVVKDEIIQLINFGYQGPQGPAGLAEEWFNGSGAPAGGLGVQGDLYLDNDNGDIYEKTGLSTWSIVANIEGPAGPAGPAADTYKVISADSGTATATSSDTLLLIGGDASIVTAASDGPDTVTVTVDIVDAGYY